MITYLKNGKSLAEKENDNQKTKETVEKILKQIELGGDKTVRDLSKKFDNYNPISFKLTADQIIKQSPILLDMVNNEEIAVVGGIYDVATGVVDFK